MKAHLFAAFFAGLLLPAAAQSQTITGIRMLPGCKANLNNAPADMFAQGVCVGAISTQMFNAYAARPDTTGSCPPETVTVEQGVRVVVAYLEANPQRLHESFNWLVVHALRQAWPCKK
jgi:hypothetical protein